MPRNTPPRTDPTRPRHVPPRNPGHRPDPARPKHQPPAAPADLRGAEQHDQDSEAPLTGRTYDDPRGTGEPPSPDRDQDSEAPRTAIPPTKR